MFNPYTHTLCILELVYNPYIVHFGDCVQSAHAYSLYSGGCVQDVNSVHCVFWWLYTVYIRHTLCIQEDVYNPYTMYIAYLENMYNPYTVYILEDV